MRIPTLPHASLALTWAAPLAPVGLADDWGHQLVQFPFGPVVGEALTYALYAPEVVRYWAEGGTVEACPRPDWLVALAAAIGDTGTIDAALAAADAALPEGAPILDLLRMRARCGDLRRGDGLLCALAAAERSAVLEHAARAVCGDVSHASLAVEAVWDSLDGDMPLRRGDLAAAVRNALDAAGERPFSDRVASVAYVPLGERWTSTQGVTWECTAVGWVCLSGADDVGANLVQAGLIRADLGRVTGEGSSALLDAGAKSAEDAA